MLSFVRGRVSRITANRVVLDVGGVGLELNATPSALAGLRTGSEATIDTALVVREDSWQLFGFGSADERGLFDLLQSVSGIGPKLALTILSAISAEDLRAAIATGDEARLVRIPGVGKKSAARLIVELGDRLPKPQLAAAQWQEDVTSALRSLGWSEKDAAAAVAAVASDSSGELDSAAALRSALAKLSKARS